MMLLSKRFILSQALFATLFSPSYGVIRWSADKRRTRRPRSPRQSRQSDEKEEMRPPVEPIEEIQPPSEEEQPGDFEPDSLNNLLMEETKWGEDGRDLFGENLKMPADDTMVWLWTHPKRGDRIYKPGTTKDLEEQYSRIKSECKVKFFCRTSSKKSDEITLIIKHPQTTGFVASQRSKKNEFYIIRREEFKNLPLPLKLQYVLTQIFSGLEKDVFKFIEDEFGVDTDDESKSTPRSAYIGDYRATFDKYKMDPNRRMRSYGRMDIENWRNIYDAIISHDETFLEKKLLYEEWLGIDQGWLSDKKNNPHNAIWCFAEKSRYNPRGKVMPERFKFYPDNVQRSLEGYYTTEHQGRPFVINTSEGAKKYYMNVNGFKKFGYVANQIVYKREHGKNNSSYRMHRFKITDEIFTIDEKLELLLNMRYSETLYDVIDKARIRYNDEVRLLGVESWKRIDKECKQLLEVYSKELKELYSEADELSNNLETIKTNSRFSEMKETFKKYERFRPCWKNVDYLSKEYYTIESDLKTVEIALNRIPSIETNRNIEDLSLYDIKNECKEAKKVITTLKLAKRDLVAFANPIAESEGYVIGRFNDLEKIIKDAKNKEAADCFRCWD